MNEADTRAELIDVQLAQAGWVSDADTGVRVRREYAINAGEIRAGGIRTGQLKADYVLEFRGVKLAVVEAKSDEVAVAEGVMQAKLYAQKLRLATSFSANGKQIYQINHAVDDAGMVTSESEVAVFPSPETLWQRVFGERTGVTADELFCQDWQGWFERFSGVPFEGGGGGKSPRYYQELAVNRAVQAIAQGRPRVLLTLATGTGKTFIAFQIAWKLFKSRWTTARDGARQPRILFLADRNILANQAFNDFSAFAPAALVRISPADIAKRGEVPTNGSVFFTIFQTFMSGEAGKPYFGQYERDFFDLVIIDECHRGGANDESSWREILDYFSGAVHLGLTATPKRTDNANTYDYFGEPVFVYSLKEGIQDGFLTPFKVKRIQTNLDDYVYTSDDEVVEGEVEQGRVYTEGDFNRTIEIEARERKRVQDLLASIAPNEKTIVFCANQAHAGLIRDLINQESDNKSVDYCVRVTANDGALGDAYLELFRDNDKTIPTILTTSQKLTTGVDARNVRHIALMRPVNSMIEFKQIIGRGTRTFEGKYYFTIIDFVNACLLFNDVEWDGEAIVEEPVDTPIVNPVINPVGKPVVPPNGNGGGEYGGSDDDKVRKAKIRIKLSDGKVRELQSMISTYFYVDGKPISAEEFLKRLFDTLKLPELLGSEEQLRTLWANPETRRELLHKLENVGCHKADLEKLQELINAQNCDLFDVLEYVAYAKTPVTRAERVRNSQDIIYNQLDNDKQREFVGYVLRNYVDVGVDELDVGKLSTVLNAKYGSTHAAQSELGELVQIKSTFVDFQRYLYAV